MKINKYLFGFLVAAIGGFTSCNTDVEGEYFPFSSEGVSFEVSSQSVQVGNTISSTTFPVSIIRSNTDKALTVNITTASSQDGIFTNDAGNTITFEPGQGTATFNVTANNLEKEVQYLYSISLDGNAVVDTLKLQTANYEKVVEYFPADPEDENSKDSIAVNSYLTNYYSSKPSKSIQIAVSREGDWISLGNATYREDLLTTFFSVDNLEYNLEIREHETKKGVYRLMNPYGEAYPYNDPGDWDSSKDYYIEINAQDPDYVYVEGNDLGFDWGYGMFYTTSYVSRWLSSGNTLEEIKAARPDMFGKMVKGVITMPANSMLISMAAYNDGAMYQSNGNGLFRVALPGAVIADYSSELSYVGIFTNPNNEVFALGDLTLGPDATDVKAIVMSQNDDADAVADAIAAGELEAYDVEAGRIEVPITEGLSGKLQLIVVVLADGAVQSVSTANFEYFSGANPWVSLGKGVFTENFVGPFFGEDPVTYEVEVMENQENPGLYRLIYPYGEIYPYNDEGDWDTSLSYDIEIDATDPEGVVIYNQPTGIDWGYGPISIQSVGARYNVVGGYDLATLKGAGYLGKLENGVITLPVFEREVTQEDGTTATAYYQGYITMGSTTYYGATAGEFKLVLPGSPALSAAKKVASRDRRFRNTKVFRGVVASPKFLKNASKLKMVR